jgi:hypothetical protein
MTKSQNPKIQPKPSWNSKTMESKNPNRW